MPTATKIKKTLSVNKYQIYTYIFIATIFLLTLFNIKNYLSVKINPVLGIETKINENDFWQGFLSEHRNYVPGWIEIGRLDKAKELDPNYYRK